MTSVQLSSAVVAFLNDQSAVKNELTDAQKSLLSLLAQNDGQMTRQQLGVQAMADMDKLVSIGLVRTGWRAEANQPYAITPDGMEIARGHTSRREKVIQAAAKDALLLARLKSEGAPAKGKENHLANFDRLVSKPQTKLDWFDRRVLHRKLNQLSTRNGNAVWMSRDELCPVLEADRSLMKVDVEAILKSRFPERAFSYEQFLNSMPTDKTQYTLQERYEEMCWLWDIKYGTTLMFDRQCMMQAMEDHEEEMAAQKETLKAAQEDMERPYQPQRRGFFK